MPWASLPGSLPPGRLCAAALRLHAVAAASRCAASLPHNAAALLPRPAHPSHPCPPSCPTSRPNRRRRRRQAAAGRAGSAGGRLPRLLPRRRRSTWPGHVALAGRPVRSRGGRLPGARAQHLHPWRARPLLGEPPASWPGPGAGARAPCTLRRSVVGRWCCSSVPAALHSARAAAAPLLQPSSQRPPMGAHRTCRPPPQPRPASSARPHLSPGAARRRSWPPTGCGTSWLMRRPPTLWSGTAGAATCMCRALRR